MFDIVFKNFPIVRTVCKGVWFSKKVERVPFMKSGIVFTVLFVLLL